MQKHYRSYIDYIHVICTIEVNQIHNKITLKCIRVGKTT